MSPRRSLTTTLSTWSSMGAGGGASGSLLASSIAGGWPPQTDPRLAIRSGGPRGSSGVDQGDLEAVWYKFMALLILYMLVLFLLLHLEPPGYEFTALWTVYALLLYLPWWKVPVNMQPNSSSLCRLTDGGWCLFNIHRQSVGHCQYATETGPHSACCAEDR